MPRIVQYLPQAYKPSFYTPPLGTNPWSIYMLDPESQELMLIVSHEFSTSKMILLGNQAEIIFCSTDGINSISKVAKKSLGARQQ